MSLGRKVGHGPSDIVLHGDPAAPPKRGQSPQFWSHDYCGQTVGWIKMALGMKVGLGPGHTVLDGDPAALSNFRPISIVAKRLDASKCRLVRM